MRISTLFYTFKQGFNNIFRNKLFSIASIATIGACLFLFGLFYAIVTNFQYIVKEAQDGVSVTVFFEEGYTEDEMQETKEQLEKRIEVDRVVFVSAEEAWESFRDDYFGEYADGFPENPLADSANLEIYLSDVSMQGTLVTYLNSMEHVRDINQSEITASVLSGVNTLIGYVSIGIIVVLLCVSVFLISNTVTIGISVRKEEIAIMKYIGATDFFVRSPFVVEGMIIGLIGSVIPVGCLYVIYNEAITYVMGRFDMLTGFLNFLPVEAIFSVLLPLSLALGVGIGFFGSIITVRKHLRV